MLQSLLPAPVESVLAPLSSWLLTCAAASTVLLGLAWFVDGRLPSVGTPAARVRLWTVAVVAPVIVATVQVASGLGPRVTLEAPEAEKVVADFEAPAESGAAASHGSATSTRALPASSPGRAVLRDPYADDRSDPAAWWASLGHDWPFLVALGWLVVAALLLLRRVVTWCRLGLALRDRVRVREGPLRGSLDAVLTSAGVEGPVTLSTSEALPSPVVLPGGEICVPERTELRLDESEQRALLAHEVAHVLRGDTRRLMVLALLHDLLFFQPLLRPARRRVEDAAEALSDDWVRTLGLARELARSLVTVARWVRTDAAGVGLARMTGPAGIERRVRRLLEAPGLHRTDVPSGLEGLVPVLVGAVLLTLAVPAAEIGTPPHPLLHAVPTADAAGEAPSTPPWVRSSTSDPPAAVRSRLEALTSGEGDAVYLRLSGASEGLSLTVRTGGEHVRLVGPGGHSVSAEPEAAATGRRRVVFLAAAVPRGNRLELRLPERVARLAVDVDGRMLADPRSLAGRDLPRIVSFP